MTDAQIGAIAIAVLGTGGLGAWLIKEVIRIRDVSIKLPAEMAELKETCKACRESINLRLSDGTDEFAQTRYDLLETSKDAAIKNAQMREEFFQRFVNEATFKDRVIATMISSCPNCRKGG